ncbi:MAG: NAD(+) synthase [Armatimonadetes bacterium]|nr:NAD(+) synthase [Armatimonadota bacterium]
MSATDLNGRETAPISPDALRIDADTAIAEIVEAIQEQVRGRLRRRGAVLGLSGGIDSSVCAALCVKSLGPERVFGLYMPEADSDPESLRLGRSLAEWLGIETALEDIAPALEAAGCYRRRDEAIRKVVPEYGPGWKSKLVLPGATGGSRLNVFSLVAQSPEGESRKVRLSLEAYLGIVAATNMKQRTRKQMEYYHADRLHYAVVGTPNRLEYDQGFFVKNGDGAADLKPIAHLYKTQVYALAEALEIPEEIRQRPPTTDTYSLPQTQEEFYFSLPYDKMDLCLYALNRGLPAEAVAGAAGLTPEQVEGVYADIRSKRRTTQYLHERPLLVQPVSERGTGADSFPEPAGNDPHR